MKSLTLLAMLLASAAFAQAQTSTGAEGQAVVVPANTETWAPAPPALPPGAQVAVLEGDPSKPGPFTMRIALPDGYRIPPHFHPVVEHVTVLQGTFLVGMGERFDAAKLKMLPAGSFGALPPGMRHFAQAKGRTVLQLHGMGPWGLTYVNPADDPRKKPS